MGGRSCLVLVYGSSNVLAAMASVRWYGESSGAGAADRVVVLVHPPVTSGEMASTNGAVVERLIASQGWPPPIVLAGDDESEITRASRHTVSYRETLRRFAARVGTGFDEVHYAHDLTGRVPELAMNAYPDAKRIVFGDALGSVYDTRYFMALAQGATIEEARRAALERPRLRARQVPRAIARWLRDAALGAPRRLPPDRAVLVLPMDQTGSALANTPISVVPKQLALDIIADCRRVLPELADYSREVLAGAPAPHFLMLLENYADADMTSFEDEVTMYETVVRRRVPKGGTVLLKTHPLAVAPIDVALRERLDPEYATRVIPRELARYPMELWSDLVSSCEVISMLSYCGISLAFLYDKSTLYPMDAGVIERFFPERSWDRVRDADVLYRGQLANLATWDGNSILWKGSLR